MNRLSLAVSALVALALLGLLGLTVARVRGLMARELDEAGAMTTLTAGTDATLLEADLEQGDFLTFELCADDALDPARWCGAATLELEAGPTEPRDHVLSEPMNAEMLALARRGSHDACIDFARAGPLGESGHYVVSIRGVAPGVAGARVRARVLAERPLTAGDRNQVLAILLGAIALVLTLAIRAPIATAPRSSPWTQRWAIGVASATLLTSVALVLAYPRIEPTTRVILALLALAACGGGLFALARRSSAGGALLGVVAIIDLSTLLSLVTPGGPAFGLIAGLALALAEVGIALALGRRLALSTGLAIQRPIHVVVAIVGFALAPVVGVLLRIAATRVLQLVPSTGEAPIEAYVSWPSGLLSFAALSAIAPIGEEVFFRGFVYGAIRGEGGRARATLAFLGAWLLFVVAHLPQTWGSWGGLLAVAVAGLGFTTLRAATGSVLVAAFAHLVYNGLLAVAALAS